MRVKILVDGNSIDSIDGSMGVIPFNAIPVGSIQKIEIIPGGGISLYGSGTASGVINIVTKMGGAKEYGNVRVSGASFDTYKAELSKGFRLSPRVFSNLSLEVKKAKGYREKEKEQGLNTMLGVNFDINAKHRIRLSGSYFQEDTEGTNEAYLSQLRKNRRQAGDSLAKTKSKRHTLGLDYEYAPTENLTITAGVQNSRLHRDIHADASPYLTFTPGNNFFLSSSTPKGYKLDIVLINAPHTTSGMVEEKKNTGKLKTEYAYKNNQGKLTFGMEHTDHRLRRELDIKAGPYQLEKMNFLITEVEKRDFGRENIKEGEELYNLELIEMYGRLNTINRKEKTLAKKYGDFLYEHSSNPESKEKYEKGADYTIFENDSDYTLNQWKAAKAFHLENAKVFDFYDKYEKDGKTGVYVNEYGFIKHPTDRRVVFKEIPEETRILDLDKILEPEVYENFKRGNDLLNHVQSRVDLKKDSSSFYLHNSYPVTEKLAINAGLRYEKAKYRGYRESESTIYFLGKKGEEPSDYVKSGIYNFLKVSAEALHNYIPLENKTIFEVKSEELKATGQTKILMKQERKEVKREEENLGGEIGFDYKLNDTDTVYAKYERAFNTPLPNQLTNKSIHPVHKLNMYWESDLQTEKMDNFEVGLRGAIGENITYGISGFLSNSYDEIITIVKDGHSHATRQWRFINLDKTRRIGLELQSEQSFGKWKFRQSFTYVNPKIRLNTYNERIAKTLAGDMEDERKEYIKNGLLIAGFKMKRLKGYKGISEEDWNEATEIYKKLYLEAVHLDSSFPYGTPEYDAINKQSEEINKKVTEEVISKFPGLTPLEKYRLETALRFGGVHEFYKQAMETIQQDYDAVTGKSDLKEGDRIPLAPKIKATFAADYQLTEGLKLGMNTTYIGSYITAEPDRIYSIVKTKVPSHWVADFYGTYELNDSFSLQFGINNLFNHKYYFRQDSKTALPAAGRTYTAGFNYRF